MVRAARGGTGVVLPMFLPLCHVEIMCPQIFEPHMRFGSCSPLVQFDRDEYLKPSRKQPGGCWLAASLLGLCAVAVRALLLCAESRHCVLVRLRHRAVRAGVRKVIQDQQDGC